PAILGVKFAGNSSLFGYGLNGRTAFFFLTAAFMLAALAVMSIIRHSRFGTILSMIRQNEQLARSLGFATNRYQLAALTIGGAITGAAGELFIYQQRVVTPDTFSMTMSIQVLMIIVIGGSRTLMGPLIGAFVIIFLPEFIQADPVDSQLIYGAV